MIPDFLSALPSVRARALAFLAIVVAGACGALIGYSFVELQCHGACAVPESIGSVVGRLKVFQALPSYSEMTAVDNTLGIRPEDHAVSVFAEPKFGK